MNNEVPLPSIEEQIAQLRSAISAQETLRPTLGDSVVELTLKALRTQIDSLLAEQKEDFSAASRDARQLAETPEMDRERGAPTARAEYGNRRRHQARAPSRRRARKSKATAPVWSP